MDYLRRIYYAITNPFTDLYKLIFRPLQWSALCFIEYNGKFLMEKINYRKWYWTFPGGGLKKKEKPELGVEREVFEELGMKIKELKYLGPFQNPRPGTNNMIHCFYKKMNNIGGLKIDVDPNEVKQYCWHELDNLPEPHYPELPDIIKFFKEKV